MENRESGKNMWIITGEIKTVLLEIGELLSAFFELLIQVLFKMKRNLIDD